MLVTKILQFASFLVKLQFKICLILWKKINPDYNARHWSNTELKKFASLFQGDIVNISAGKDNDKEGSFYKNYFSKAKTYSITNYQKLFGTDPNYNEVIFDLAKPLDNNSAFNSKFDVVFTHTVLEHIFEIDIATENLCKISKDLIINIVPFIQSMHQNEDIYHDYWRFSPYTMTRLFEPHGFKTLYINWNNDPFGNIYIIHIATKCYEKWKPIIKGNISSEGPGYIRQTFLNSTASCKNGLIKNVDII